MAVHSPWLEKAVAIYEDWYSFAIPRRARHHSYLLLLSCSRPRRTLESGKNVRARRPADSRRYGAHFTSSTLCAQPGVRIYLTPCAIAILVLLRGLRQRRFLRTYRSGCAHDITNRSSWFLFEVLAQPQRMEGTSGRQQHGVTSVPALGRKRRASEAASCQGGGGAERPKDGGGGGQWDSTSWLSEDCRSI